VNNRSIVFISHANPEDNEFSRWLALQLAKNGYQVWCDLTRLLGGEDFWSDIEGAIREHTYKFLYVLSRTSNHRPGTLQELHLADSVARKEGLSNFIIPLRIDDLPTTEFNIQIARRIAIDFTSGWAIGLKQLMEKLEKEKVQKNSSFTPESVASWWKTQFATECQLINRHDEYMSNIFPIVELPQTLFAHRLKPTFYLLSKPARYPYRRYQGSLLSFASVSDLEQSFEIPECIADSQEIALEELIQGNNSLNIGEFNARNIVIDLLRQAWEKSIDDIGMLKYEMGQRSITAYFKKDFLKTNRVKILGNSERNTSRQILGYETRKDWKGNVLGKRYWHYSLQFRPTFTPALAFTAISHVLFSYDGENILPNKGLIHRLRRSKCRDWWNSEWRDRIIGTVQWLASGEENICFKLGSKAVVKVDSKPLMFNSDVSYIEPKSKVLVFDSEDEDDDFTEEDPDKS
jgi:hypothetical protein